MNLYKYLKFIANPKKYYHASIHEKVNNAIKNELRMQSVDTILETDVVVAGYPKSGNTWFQNIITGLYFGIDLDYCNYNLISSLSVDIHIDKYYKRYGDVVFFKSHLQPQPNYKKAILLIRDGRDVMVSYYHHLKKYENPNITYEDLLSSKTTFLPYGAWDIHVNSWLDNPYKADILVIKYEDMLLNTMTQVDKVCTFLNIDRPQSLKTKVIQQSSFGEMKNREITKGWGSYESNPDKTNTFVRKGISGSYKQEFPAHLLSDYTNKIYPTLTKLGYEV
ncbi:MAG: sulfotransferase domain-containing protein [Cytophagales bacterium]|nr:sulfotransferase domain-containing protein [Cytophagales bacterium]